MTMNRADVWRQIAETERELAQLVAEPEPGARFAGSFVAYAVVWGSLARPSGGAPTVFTRGAFEASDPRRTRLLYGHDEQQPIGVITSLREDARGLLMEAKFSRTPKGEEIAELVRSGALTDVSVGFTARRASMEKRAGVGMVRVVHEADLAEVSVVLWGADEQARVTEAAHRDMGGVERTGSDVMAEVRAAEADWKRMFGEKEVEVEETRKDWIRRRTLGPLEVMRRAENGRLERLQRALQKNPELAKMRPDHLTAYVEAEHEAGLMAARTTLRPLVIEDTDRR